MAQKFETKMLTTFYIEGSLGRAISELQKAKRLYGEEGWGDLEIRGARTCGHPFWCECGETPALFGTRAVSGE